MSTRGSKIGILIDALDNGAILYRIIDNEKQFMFKMFDSYEIKGWGAALGDANNRIIELVANPDQWHIFESFNMQRNGYPYPWSSKYKDNE